MNKTHKHLKFTISIFKKKEITLNRSIDRRLEHISLHAILNYPFDLIVKILTAMLIEKQIIFLSSKLRYKCQKLASQVFLLKENF